MKSQRDNFMPQMMPFQGMNTMPANMMMFPNYMNDNYNNLDNRITSLEKKVKTLENRISRLENPYQTMGQNQTNQPYQTTQNNPGYNGEMYMM